MGFCRFLRGRLQAHRSRRQSGCRYDGDFLSWHRFGMGHPELGHIHIQLECTPSKARGRILSFSRQGANGGPIVLTGHSLGGALAGFVGAIYDVETITFDHIDYRGAAQALYAAATFDGFSPDTAIAREAYYDGITPTPPSFAQISSYAVSGEVAAWDRYDNAYVTQIEPGATDLNPESLHKQTLLAILQGAGSRTAWRAASRQVLDALFSDVVALAAGEKPKGVDGANVAFEKMQAMIAYSAIGSTGGSEGKPFGDTGEQALFDDADQLGTALAAQSASSTISASAQALSDALVQFSAQLALGKVLDQQTPEAKNGILTHRLCRHGNTKLVQELT